jgi:hypothetical protein
VSTTRHRGDTHFEEFIDLVRVGRQRPQIDIQARSIVVGENLGLVKLEDCDGDTKEDDRPTYLQARPCAHVNACVSKILP